MIHGYFVKEWGYDPRFVVEGINFTESRLSEFSVTELAQSLAQFTRENPDCNFKMMSREILGFLRNILEAGGKTDEHEEETINRIESTFKVADKFSLKKNLKAVWGAFKGKVHGIFSKTKPAG